MKRIALFLSLIALPLGAQTDTALVRRIFQLEENVAQLQMIVGTKGFMSPSIPCDSMEARRPTWYFPNGEYDLSYRNKQFGCAMNGVVDFVSQARQQIAGLQSQVTGVAARTAAIESSVAGGQPVGTAVFDRITARRICIVDAGLSCDDDWNAQLQMRGVGLVNIGMEANMGHIDPQDAEHTHVSQWNVSTDGGTRIQQNAKSTFSRGFVSYVNPCRPWLNFGPDSRANLSLYRGPANEQACTPLPHDNAQDLVFLPEESTREFKLFLPRPLWNFRIVGSSSVNAADLTLQPKQ